MEDKRLEKIEEMLTNLITMVGGMRSEQQSMREDQASMRSELVLMREDQAAMKTEITAIKEDQAAMRTEMDGRHREIMVKLNEMKADQDYTWQIAVGNQREIVN
ncbi:hypothetical protein CVD25_03715 [Bacillus canaveralius]|uniref:Uncharacterized protein n=1 Tax=Bacillus canaveralius TaxID=1403243 RepID=A0A2N5GSG1_9BACI|nr:hypothetical protein [Bacillus canaveralius]PLR86583.1 hypothetical protein CU635_01310 [Bacillus canaveralius]PLS00354.1 hypothetical protein CVD25_03715 [Bacillus canaveralius]